MLLNGLHFPRIAESDFVHRQRKRPLERILGDLARVWRGPTQASRQRERPECVGGHGWPGGYPLHSGR
ncbi:hypothetical protein Spa11_18040 [Botrimarina mediterranea]|uniref:Uncharacterized protein n=1 Tax=Botrimarina mediterranea TaxID=2528022 RepID=A0A518K742_9BACT|nr:hypothetical protein Spa11_18040 [Botrimarina mediterranea]